MKSVYHYRQEILSTLQMYSPEKLLYIDATAFTVFSRYIIGDGCFINRTLTSLDE